jgi:hypothetical protein
MAHPDDELFSFGAWLNQVNTIICCTYRKNHEKIRCLETICEKFDIELHFVENKPFYIDIAFTVNCIENLLTEKNILTHHPNDLHQDHKRCFHICQILQNYLFSRATFNYFNPFMIFYFFNPLLHICIIP